MFTLVKKALRSVAVVAGVVSLAAVPAIAFAQDPIPSYATQDQSIKGTVVSYDGTYSLHVRDDRGFIDNVKLHQGTIINPTGLRLEPGFSVTITGHPDGNAYVANQIDTPYYYEPGITYYPAYPYPYYYPTYWNAGFGFGFHHFRGGYRRW